VEKTMIIYFINVRE